MSSSRWKKLHARKTYRERGQSEDRAHLGLLEKKKDYKQRARDFHRKQDAIHALEVKAAFRNPDEFYHKMIRTRKRDGKHISLDSDLPPTLAEKLDLQTSDIAYLTMRKTMEGRKVDEMKGRMSMAREVDAQEMRRKHTVFVDSPNDAAQFDEAQYFETDADYLSRAYNRPRTRVAQEEEDLQDDKESEELEELEESEDLEASQTSQGSQDDEFAASAREARAASRSLTGLNTHTSPRSSLPQRKRSTGGNISTTAPTLIVGKKGGNINDTSARASLNAAELSSIERQRSLAYGELAARMKRSSKLEDTLDRLKLRHNLAVRPDSPSLPCTRPPSVCRGGTPSFASI